MLPEVVILVSGAHWQCATCKLRCGRDVSLDLHLQASHPSQLDLQPYPPSDLHEKGNQPFDEKRRSHATTESVASSASARVCSDKHVNDTANHAAREFVLDNSDIEDPDANVDNDHDSDSDFVPPDGQKTRKNSLRGRKSKRGRNSVKQKQQHFKGKRKTGIVSHPALKPKSAETKVGRRKLKVEKELLTAMVKPDEDEKDEFERLESLGRPVRNDSSEKESKEVSVNKNSSAATFQCELKTNSCPPNENEGDREEENSNETGLENETSDMEVDDSAGDTVGQTEKYPSRSAQQLGNTSHHMRTRVRPASRKRSRFSPEPISIRSKSHKSNVNTVEEPRKRGRPPKPKPTAHSAENEDEDEPVAKRVYR
jgi:hypothetical protein